MIDSHITAIEYYLPERLLRNENLAEQFPDWPAEKIEAKTGICTRHIAAEDETAADLAFAAAQKLLDSGVVKKDEIDFILLCTQSPDFFLPTTACLLQARLGVPVTAGALDFNLGCSGFVYGLGLAKGLIETGQARNILFITAETYSKFMHSDDRSVRSIFGDAAAATLIQAGTREADESPSIGPFVYGTDGNGANNLCVPVGGMRNREDQDALLVKDDSGNARTSLNLYMNGPEIFAFTLRSVPSAFNRLLEVSGISLDDIDLIVFHQANRYMLDHLRRKMNLPANKFVVSMREVGNTVSASIPLALKMAANENRLLPGQLVMLVGFGVGYSWGATLIKW
jgi:3-oxoacyl-[acyl-carrier-protein] synthase-3